MDELDAPFPATVILRRLRYEPQKGEIIAVFPYLLEPDGMCMTYMHVGQHWATSYYHVIRGTKPVDENEEDAQKLLSELRNGYGYVITLAKKINSNKLDAARREQRKQETVFQAYLRSQGMLN
jgi:hypothetical protein